ncbi:MAG: PAS domain-containing protein [Acidobacteriota bacterium]
MDEPSASPRILLLDAAQPRRDALVRRLASTGLPIDAYASVEAVAVALRRDTYVLALLTDAVPTTARRRLTHGAPTLRCQALDDGFCQRLLADDAAAAAPALLQVQRAVNDALLQRCSDLNDALRRVQTTLRATHRLHRRLIDVLPWRVYLYDLAEQRIVYANHSIERMLGYDDEEISNRLGDQRARWSALIHPDDREHLPQLIERYDPADSFVTREYRMRHRDGNWRWLRNRNLVVHRTPEGRPRQIVGLVEDITPAKRAQEDLDLSRQELRQLAEHLQRVRESERAAMSREIHDQLGQDLTALRLSLSVLQGSLRRTALGDAPADSRAALAQTVRDAAPTGLPDPIDQTLEMMAQLVDSTTQTVRRIARDLRPVEMSGLEPISVLRGRVEDFARHTGIAGRFTSDLQVIDLAPEHATHLLRIMQEALTNASRHGRSTHIEVLLTADADDYILIVADDGAGFDPSTLDETPGVGILNMRERVLLCGGQLTIDSEQDMGTRITVRLPIVSSRVATTARAADVGVDDAASDPALRRVDDDGGSGDAHPTVLPLTVRG